MSSHAPAILIAFMTKPVMSQLLGVKIVRLEGRVVNVRFGTFEKEEAVVVHLF